MFFKRVIANRLSQTEWAWQDALFGGMILGSVVGLIYLFTPASALGPILGALTLLCATILPPRVHYCVYEATSVGKRSSLAAA
jgi:hypothetical protein